MANVTVTMIGRKALVNSGQFNAAFTTYLQIATDNGLVIPSNGFMIELWDPIGGQHPSSIVFQWLKPAFPEAQLSAVYAGFKALGVTHSFTPLNFDVAPG